MDAGAVSAKEMPLGLDANMEEEYASQSKLLQEFTSISTINKAWVFKSGDGDCFSAGNSASAMFSVGQPNLLANKKRTYILSSQITEGNDQAVSFQWAPFPIEMTGVSTIVPSPSGLKMLVVRNQENGSPTQLEIWSGSHLQKEIPVPISVHGSVFTDGWFEGISWNSDETLIAYVAEEPSPSKPAFDGFGYKKGGSSDKDSGSWKGQGDWEEDWGESYVGKRQPALFVVNIVSGKVHAVEGVSESLSVGQVVWAPILKGVHQYLVFVGWSSSGPHQKARKLGMIYCYNRPCALYAVRAPTHESEVDTLQTRNEVASNTDAVINLTQGITSAYFPRFSPDGNYLVFLSSKCAVDTGAHSATDSLHRIDWPMTRVPCSSSKIIDVVPVVMSAEEGLFPGLYCSSLLSKPWLLDGRTMIFSSFWGSMQVILSVNILSGTVSHISTTDSSSWNVLALNGDHILTVSSSPIDPPQIKYGSPLDNEGKSSARWGWTDVSSPIARYSEKVRSLLASLKYSVLKIPVRDASENLTEGNSQAFTCSTC
ncbi:hypothetical protein IFM89_002345 [Coptis chinensis]|uniref:Acylamino-acid-releasing enzyme N-terminal domain-containing protein n=1 Tax=Coptis chinensis TaxID=261450 RepID=A0A835IGR5_9MAGN|nr:hypothetical protein IFM89_002345 [Coptis chinensis]